MKEILVVDNQPVVLRFMTRLLEKNGHRVWTASDGLAALDILRTQTPDIIFIDLVMPNISGDKLCRIIRRMPKFSDVFIVILSAIAAEEKSLFTDFGADILIAKGPFDQMTEHILSVIDPPMQDCETEFKGKILGDASIYKRAITRELLESKKTF